MKNVSGIKPTGHYVLIKPDQVEEKTSGGIILAPSTVENEQRDTTKGTLVAVGPTGWSELGYGHPWAEPGDHVSYGRHAGRFMKGSDGVEYVLMNCEDILAVLNE